MGIPFWLLRLLPNWEYICPKCRVEVPKNSHICHHCGEKYPLPLKIPPTLLEDKKKLEEYVHKVIFPKVSAKHRQYLTQFFTEIFSDGQVGSTMETAGDFSAWTGTTVSPTVSTTQKHHGSNAAKFTTPLQTAYKTIAASPTAYARCYVYFDTLPTTGRQEVFYLGDANDTYGVNLELFYDSGVVKWRTFWVDNADNWQSYVSDTPTPQTGQMYCVEIKWQSGTSGGAQTWINGTSIGMASGTTKTGDIVRLSIGTKLINVNMTEYIDCVVVADAYIGLESAETLQTVTDSLSLSDAALRHKALLQISDSATLAEAFSRGKAFTLIDSLNLADTERVLKELLVHDVSSLADSASTVSRILQVSESVSVVEVVQVGTGGVTKTKLFLILGDLALQLT